MEGKGKIHGSECGGALGECSTQVFKHVYHDALGLALELEEINFGRVVGEKK